MEIFKPDSGAWQIIVFLDDLGLRISFLGCLFGVLKQPFCYQSIAFTR